MSVANKKRKVFDGLYEVLSIVGRGSCSVVYHARHAMSPSAEVALKVLLNQKGQTSNGDRLRKEALAMVASRHRYVVRLDDFHSVKDLCYLSMEYAREGDLRKYYTKKGKLPLEQAQAFFTQSAEALNFIHKVGIVHRDIKPDNILVVSDAEIRIADFGVAVLPGESASMDELRSGVGTMNYMAPEVLEGRFYDRASDMYALAVTFYELISGVHPFENAPLIKQLEIRQDNNIKPLAKLVPNIPPKLSSAIMRAMAYDSERRFESMADLLKELGVPQSATPAPRSPRESDQRRLAQPGARQAGAQQVSGGQAVARQAGAPAPKSPVAFPKKTPPVTGKPIPAGTGPAAQRPSPDTSAQKPAQPNEQRAAAPRPGFKAAVPQPPKRPVAPQATAQPAAETARPSATPPKSRLADQIEKIPEAPKRAASVTTPAAATTATKPAEQLDANGATAAAEDQGFSIEPDFAEQPKPISKPKSEKPKIMEDFDDEEVDAWGADDEFDVWKMDDDEPIESQPAAEEAPVVDEPRYLNTRKDDRTAGPTGSSAKAKARIDLTSSRSQERPARPVQPKFSTGGAKKPSPQHMLIFAGIVAALFLARSWIFGGNSVAPTGETEQVATESGGDGSEQQQQTAASFTSLPAGMYTGSVLGFLPARTLPIMIISMPDSHGMVIILGLEGWTPSFVKISDSKPDAKVRVASNGYVLDFSATVENGELNGKISNAITGEQSEWKATRAK